MHNQRSMNVFDLDGVITNPGNSRVNNKVLDQMHAHLLEGKVLAINTGRSYDWVAENLVNYLIDRDNAFLDDEVSRRLLIVCEKGGELVTLTGGRASVAPSRFALAQAIHNETKQLFHGLQSQLDTMFWDQTKRTMATIEKLPAADLSRFHDQQKHLVVSLEERFADENVRIDPTTIATDVESVEAGKDAGAEIIDDWIKARYPDIAEFICFGDSVSDFAMARYFADQGADSVFIYVGKHIEELPRDPRIRVSVTTDKFDAGALGYLLRPLGESSVCLNPERAPRV